MPLQPYTPVPANGGVKCSYSSPHRNRRILEAASNSCSLSGEAACGSGALQPTDLSSIFHRFLECFIDWFCQTILLIRSISNLCSPDINIEEEMREHRLYDGALAQPWVGLESQPWPSGLDRPRPKSGRKELGHTNTHIHISTFQTETEVQQPCSSWLK